MRDAEKQFEASHRILAEASAGSARELDAGWQAMRRARSAPVPAEPAPAEPAPAAGPEAGERPTVAVLPFASVGGDGGDYFSQGISDEIAAELARFADLTILAPSTTMRVKDAGAPVPEIAGRLRANYLLDGVVTRANQRMRMTARLLDGASGANVWAERFDRRLGDIFEVQDEITRTVAASLSIRLRDTGVKRSLRKRTRDLSAYDLMLRARRYVAVLTPEEHAKARDCLEEAVRRDPGYADAHAALVYVYAAEYSHGHNPRPQPLERAMAAGRRALELDPQNPRAHASLALTHFFRRDDAIFASEAERALALNPNDPEMAGMLGAYFVYSGDHERGLSLLTESMRLNPLHPSWYHYSFVIRHVMRGEIDEALARLALVDIQEFHWTLVLKAALLGLKGAAADAGATYRQFRARYPGFDVRDYLNRWIRSPDYVARILAGLAEAERAAGAAPG
jgi:TolB-like protein/Tfp pilus assembly protein PilF